ncbi:MAG: hypothetical protein LBU78_05430, partial [Microbacterium sp.]|nr:hypothetical protein [Microbacterium sp.]
MRHRRHELDHGKFFVSPSTDGRVRIGYVYLAAYVPSPAHPRYALLNFWAATSRMSRLFEQSAEIRRTFIGLAEAAGGVCCALDRGEGDPE